MSDSKSTILRGLENKMIKTTVANLFDIMRPYYANFPNDYLVLDTETTGLRFYKNTPRFFPDSDLITQIGWCFVKDKKAIRQGSFILNWLLVDTIDKKALIERLNYTKQAVEFKDGKSTGKKFHMTVERMEQEGVDPIAVLGAFKADLLDHTRNSKQFFVAHNGYSFDARMLENHTRYWLNDPFVFGDNEIFDTGMVEKAHQIACMPWTGETVRNWSFRTYKGRIKGIKWALDSICVKRYNLDIRHYLPMDINGRVDGAHDSEVDAYVCHLLFEEYKDILSGRRQEPNLEKEKECQIQLSSPAQQ